MRKAVVWLFVGVALGFMLLPAVSLADVRDGAGFFSPATVEQANRQIADINGKYGKDVVIETYPALPANLAPQLESLGQERFYANWLRDRAAQLGLDGVLVLITRQPAYIQVGQGGDTARAAFTADDRNRLRDGLVSTFRQRQYDDGLLRAVAFVDRTMASHAPSVGAGTGAAVVPGAQPAGGRDATVPAQRPATADQPAPQPQGRGGGFSIWSLLIWGAIIFFGIRVIRGLMARRRAASMPPPMPGGYPNRQYPAGHPQYGDQHPQQPGYPQRGGFGTGMGGGLLGGLAGGWLYDRVFRGNHGRDAGWSSTDPNRNPDQAQPGVSGGGGVFAGDDRGQDFGSSGGSFDTGGGDSGGGGDAGGGDSGGGSF